MSDTKLNDLDIALKAAMEGAQVIKSYRDKKLNTREKGHHDLVTDADIATEKKILSVITHYFPNDQILAEETAGNKGLTPERTWIVDPIDGTTNFAHDFPIYCVSIALWENKKPTTAVVIEINRNEVFTAQEGNGAFLNGKPINVSDTLQPRNAFIATGFPYNDLSLVDPYLELFRHLMEELQGIRRPGAATYDLCCVACGRFDGFFEYSLQAWDVAAASLIIKEAGGTVTNWMGEDDWLFAERLIAGNRHIHNVLLERIRDYIPMELCRNIRNLGSSS